MIEGFLRQVVGGLGLGLFRVYGLGFGGLGRWLSVCACAMLLQGWGF